MALPTSGTLTYEMIKLELNVTGSKSLDDLIQASTLSDKTAPHNISQFYGYGSSNPNWLLSDMEVVVDDFISY